MPKNMPKTLYAKRVIDGEVEFFTADDDIKGLAEPNEKQIVGRYELKETVAVEMVLSTKKM